MRNIIIILTALFLFGCSDDRKDKLNFLSESAKLEYERLQLNSQLNYNATPQLASKYNELLQRTKQLDPVSSWPAGNEIKTDLLALIENDIWLIDKSPEIPSGTLGTINSLNNTDGTKTLIDKINNEISKTGK